MINKIKSINCASYKNYTWENSLENFKNINIFYGYNGAGKTMLSRIMRCFEQQKLNQDYEEMTFEIEFDGKKFSQDDIQSANLPLVVYNKDFINDNLRFLINGKKDGSIKSFSSMVIGEDNSEIFEEIETLKESENNLNLQIENLQNQCNQLQYEITIQNDITNERLRERAKHIRTILDIPQSSYTIKHIQNDINTIINKQNFHQNILSTHENTKLINMLKEEAKNILSFNIKFEIEKFSKLANDSKILIETKLIAKQEIENNLRKWLEEGLKQHENAQKCHFCGGELSANRIQWLLDNLSDDKKDELLNNISNQLAQLRNFYKDIQEIINFLTRQNTNDFYLDLKGEYESKRQTSIEFSKAILSQIKNIGEVLHEKELDLYKDITFNIPADYSQMLGDALMQIEQIYANNNEKTQNLQAEKQNAKNKIKLHEICTLLRDIRYFQTQDEIEQKIKNIEKISSQKDAKTRQIKYIKEQISSKKALISSEQASADKINKYLKSNFGNSALEFRAIEENKAEFKIYRNGIEADNLSEGECSLVGFCYFMAKLQNADKKSIVWIDDPISSLDSNHIFFIFSLIDSELFENKDLKFNQLFISTHNLDFLKYLKKLKSIANNKTDSNKIDFLKYLKKLKPKRNDLNESANLYIIEKNENGSQIKDMPKFLKNYTSEFNYLFEQIYDNAFIDKIKDEDTKTTIVYNFGNNLRKFLEIYLFFKYPIEKSFGAEVIEKFFKSEILINKYANEFSHLREILERTMKPLDIAQSKKIAEFVLKTIKQKDPEQFKALCESIGKSDELYE